MKALGMFGSPIKLPKGGILMRFHWQYQIKVNWYLYFNWPSSAFQWNVQSVLA